MEIFQSGNKHIEFFMENCPEKAYTVELIQKYGGVITPTFFPNAIYLVPYEVNFILRQQFSHPIFSYKFIHDSVALQSLQLLSLYEITLFSSLQPAKIPIRKIVYSDEEDQTMLRYVRDTPGNPNVVSFWRTAKQKIDINHTADSMRCHWRCVCERMNNLKKYAKNVTRTIQKNQEDRKENNFYQPKCKFENQDANEFFNMENPVKTPIKMENCFSTGSKESTVVKREIINSYQGQVKVKKIESEIQSFSEIQNFFDNLVNVCTYKSGQKVPPETIVEILAKYEGSVRATLEYFSQ